MFKRLMHRTALLLCVPPAGLGNVQAQRGEVSEKPAMNGCRVRHSCSAFLCPFNNPVGA